MGLRIHVILASILILLSAAGCGGGSKNIALLPEEGTELRTYEVFGMDCPGCHVGLEKLVNKLPGVIESQANWEKKRLAVRIEENSGLKDEEIFESIKKANFTPGKRID